MDMARHNFGYLTLFMICLSSVKSQILNETAFVIMSQDAHDSRATSFKDTLMRDLTESGVEAPIVLLLHKDLPILGGWSIFPILNPLLTDYSEDVNWFVFLNEFGRVDVNIFEGLLQESNTKKEVFLGKALQDEHAVIIHFYEKNLDMKYPDFSAGFILSRPLADRLSKDYQIYSTLPLSEIQNSRGYRGMYSGGYTIDPQHELAMRIYNRTEATKKEDTLTEQRSCVSLIDDRRLCTQYSEGCGTWISEKDTRTSNMESIYLAKRTFFAVKTCKKHHKERLPIISETWGKSALNIEYFSETKSKKYNTTLLPEVNQNTEKGHCLKSHAILKYFERYAEKNGWKWLVIADDDTILGVQNLFNLLQHYNPSRALLIGERYGYLLSKEKLGFDYLAGGAGMVFSVKMVKEMLQDNGKYCSCPKPGEHDDMFLAGSCIKLINKSILHNDRFHQNSPSVYPPKLLENQDPISFHKFRTIDPEHGTFDWNNPKETYKKYFMESDTFLRTYKKENRET